MARPINHAHLEISIWLIDCTTFGRKKIIIAIIINSLELLDVCLVSSGPGQSLPPPILSYLLCEGGQSQPIRGQDVVSVTNKRPGNLQRVMAGSVADVCNGHILLDVSFFCQPGYHYHHHFLPSCQMLWCMNVFH